MLNSSLIEMHKIVAAKLSAVYEILKALRVSWSTGKTIIY